MVSLEFLVKQSRAWGFWGSWSRVFWVLWKTRGMRRGENSCLRLNPFHLSLWGSLGKPWEIKLPMGPGMPSQSKPGFASEDQNSLEIQGGSALGYPWGRDGGSGCALCPQLCLHTRLEERGRGLGVTKGCAGSGLCSHGSCARGSHGSCARGSHPEQPLERVNEPPR